MASSLRMALPAQFQFRSVHQLQVVDSERLGIRTAPLIESRVDDVCLAVLAYHAQDAGGLEPLAVSLKEHAWKTIPATPTEQHRNTSSRNQFNDLPL